MVWQLSNNVWTLTQVVGAGDIGFTWDGSVLTTNQPMPTNINVVNQTIKP
jgi:hypothetical protein